MKIHDIDNTIKNLGKTVLWQYDKAYRLLSVLKHMQMLYHVSVTEFWSVWVDKILNIENCNAFGTSLWGMLLGVPRPTVTNPDGTSRLVATSVYRKILKGAFFLMRANSSYADIQHYIEIVFGVMGNDNLSPWKMYCSEYGWKTNDLNEDGMTNGTWYLRLIDPQDEIRKIGAGVSDALQISCSYQYGATTITAVAQRNRKCGITLTDNGDMSITYAKSQYFDQMHQDQRDLFEQKMDEYLPFPLGIKDNEPVEEWVFGFAKDEYRDWDDVLVGDTVKVGELITYDWQEDPEAQSEPNLWRCMREYKKIDDNFPYPYVPLKPNYYPDYYFMRLGPMSEVEKDIDEGQENERYEAGIGYEKDHIFGYVDALGHGFNYKCLKDISASENSSFKAIEKYLKKTGDGDPFLGRLLNTSESDIGVTCNVFEYQGMHEGVDIAEAEIFDRDSSDWGNMVWNQNPINDKYLISPVAIIGKTIITEVDGIRWRFRITDENSVGEGDFWNVVNINGKLVLLTPKMYENTKFKERPNGGYVIESRETLWPIIFPADFKDYFEVTKAINEYGSQNYKKYGWKPALTDLNHETHNTGIATFVKQIGRIYYPWSLWGYPHDHTIYDEEVIVY